MAQSSMLIAPCWVAWVTRNISLVNAIFHGITSLRARTGSTFLTQSSSEVTRAHRIMWKMITKWPGWMGMKGFFLRLGIILCLLAMAWFCLAGFVQKWPYY